MFYAICASCVRVSAQTVTNVTATQVNKTIHVSYDLDKQADITLHLSTDGGKNYQQLSLVSGDVGKGVDAGHKTIVWDVLAERERLVGDNIVFKVKAQGGSDLEFTVNGVTFKMIYVEGGTFTMGCTSEQGSDCKAYENPAHSVTLSDFYMGETEVTQALWQAVMGSNPSRFKGNDRPVEKVSWDDCQVFIRKLNQLTGKTFRLPMEAQWEYAARGGNRSGGFKYAGSNNKGKVAWYSGNSGGSTHSVKGKLPNELGLYDMSGNVWEWCSDGQRNYNSSPQTNPKGPSSGSERVRRGGCWECVAVCCRVSHRSSFYIDYRGDTNGLRLALSK